MRLVVVVVLIVVIVVVMLKTTRTKVVISSSVRQANTPWQNPFALEAEDWVALWWFGGRLA